MPTNETVPNVAPGSHEPDASPVRLLHVLGYAGVSGAHAGQTGVERVVEQLLEGLESFEHNVVYPPAGAMLSRYRQLSNALLVREPSHRFERRFVDDVAAFIEARNVQIVLSHGFLRNDFLTALACRRTGRPHVVSRAVPLADEGLSWPRRTAYGLTDGWTLRRAAHVVACSEATRRRIIETQRFDARKISAIPNGVQLPQVDDAARVEARRALGIDASTFIVGGIGQLIARKRFTDLVDAVAQARAQRAAHGREIIAVLLGAGPEREALMQRAHELCVPLHLPGFMPDPWSTLATFDVSVLPSRAEGMPLSVLESMALSVPVVATNVAGTPEVVEDGRSGFLFAPGDVTSLAQRIVQLAADAGLRTQIGTQGAERVATHFSLQAMLQGFERCLRAVLHARS